MYYELYIDILFLENLILDYLLLRQVRLLLGTAVGRKRLFPAAVFGSGCFCVLYLFSVVKTIPGVFVSCILINICMAKIAFPGKKAGGILGVSILLYFSGLLLGGLREVIREYVGFQNSIWEVLVIPIWILLEIPIRVMVKANKQKAVLCPISVLYGGKVRKTVGLLDTGNRLRDPLYQKPVCVVEKSLLEPELSSEEMLFPIPYHSVGNTNGTMQAVVADYLSVNIGNQSYVIERPVLGIAEEALSGDGDYGLIINPDILDK